MTVKVYLGLGSNIDRHRHLARGLELLQKQLGHLEISPLFESEAVGFQGDPFFNLVVGIETDMPLDALISLLREIEAQNGRVRSAKKFSARTLDIDILTYANLTGLHHGIVLPRPEILKAAFVLYPLALLAPEQVLPGTTRSYQSLWEDFDKHSQQLTLLGDAADVLRES